MHDTEKPRKSVHIEREVEHLATAVCKRSEIGCLFQGNFSGHVVPYLLVAGMEYMCAVTVDDNAVFFVRIAIPAYGLAAVNDEDAEASIRKLPCTDGAEKSGADDEEVIISHIN